MTTPDPQETLKLGLRLQDEIIAPMKRAFVAKDEIINLLGVPLVAGENIFLHGPPARPRAPWSTTSASGSTAGRSTIC